MICCAVGSAWRVAKLFIVALAVAICEASAITSAGACAFELLIWRAGVLPPWGLDSMWLVRSGCGGAWRFKRGGGRSSTWWPEGLSQAFGPRVWSDAAPIIKHQMFKKVIATGTDSVLYLGGIQFVVQVLGLLSRLGRELHSTGTMGSWYCSRTLALSGWMTISEHIRQHAACNWANLASIDSSSLRHRLIRRLSPLSPTGSAVNRIRFTPWGRVSFSPGVGGIDRGVVACSAPPISSP